MNDVHGEARSYVNLGNIKELQNEWDAAAENHQRALELMEQLGDGLAVAKGCESLGEIYLKKIDFNKAEEYFTRAQAGFDELKDQASSRTGSG